MCLFLYLPRISPMLTSVLPSLLPPLKNLKIPIWISPLLLDRILAIWKQPTWYQHQMVLLPISVIWLSDKRRYLELLTSYWEFPVKYISKCALCVCFLPFLIVGGWNAHKPLSNMALCHFYNDGGHWLGQRPVLQDDSIFCQDKSHRSKTAGLPLFDGHYSTSRRQRYWHLHNCKFFSTVNWFIQNVPKKNGQRHQ